MTHFTPARVAIALAATSIAALTISSALAQTPPPATQRPATPARPPAATAPKPPAAQTPAQPAPQQAQPAQPDAGQQAAFPPLMFSQWVKFCVGPDGQPADQKDPQIKTKQLCMTGIDGRAESGQPLIGVVAIEAPGGENKKVLRVTFPFGMLLQRGTRVIIDDTQPMQAPFLTCYPGGCYADYDLTNDSLTKMKKGKTVYVQAITIQQSPVTVGVPLTEFAKAFDNPPADPKVLEEQQKKLEEDLKRKGEELQKKAKEARDKLEGAPKQ